MEPESVRGKARGRRGHRIARRIRLMIHWREPQGQWREIPAETRMLSRHGLPGRLLRPHQEAR